MYRTIFILVLFIGIAYNAAQAQVYTSDQAETPELKILSWNIHMLPYCVYYKTKKHKRAKAIVEALDTSSYNIIVFQEAFHQVVRGKIRRALKEKYPYAYGPANKRFLSLKANSGIWILSDQPLIHLDEIEYEHATGDGKLARKGALMLQGSWYGHLFQLLGTHNNGGPINNSQFHDMRQKLLDPYRIKEVPQIICGDYNTKKSSPNDQWNSMLRTFDVDEGYVQHDDRAPDHKLSIPTNDIYERFPDFIFIRGNGDTDLLVDRIATESIGPTWVQEPKKRYGHSVGLSDHFPVSIKLHWRNTNPIAE